jgi:endonuclease YncB( thermonuclease family)
MSRAINILLGAAAIAVVALDLFAIAQLQARPVYRVVPDKSVRPVKPEPAVKRCISPVAIDGDTIKCGTARRRVSIRLIGIDAPELHGHCRTGRFCAPGDPFASTDSLAAAINTGRVTVQVFGTDLYLRRLAIVRAGKAGVNLSCLQLHSGNAIYHASWDTGRRIAKECL